MLIAFVIALAVVALVVQNLLAARRLERLANAERMRQDLLLNRIQARSLVEYTAASQAQGNTPNVSAAVAPPEPVRYLYDPTGLVQIPAPSDLADPAYEEAGSV